MKPISRSFIEEALCALYLIAAFTALGAGAPRWIFVTLLIKAALDFMCALKYAWREIKNGEND